MRHALGWLAGISFLCCSGMTCCGVGGPELLPVSAHDGCAWGGCPVGIGTDAELYISSLDPIASVELDVPELADLVIDDARLRVRGRAEGSSALTVTLADGTIVGSWIHTAGVASTVVVPDPSLAGFRRVYPPGFKQAFEGTTVRLLADHQTAAGGSLLGHGIEEWSATAGVLVAPDADLWFVDVARIRDLVATGAPQIRVSARPDGTPFELDVVPAGSTQTLELQLQYEAKRFGSFSLRAGSERVVPVYAFSADGRYIHGIPAGGAVTAVVAVPEILDVQAVPGDRALRFRPLAAGSTQLDVAFDGAVARFTVDVY